MQVILPDGSLGAILPRGKHVRGSHDATCRIQTSRCHGRDGRGLLTHIHISGSPKFLQGHNVFGINDVRRLVALMATRALACCGVEATEMDRARWERGDFKLTVLDITEMLDTGSETNASAWMRAAGEHCRVKYRGGGKFDGGTLYFGKHSRLWALKFYQKYEELFSRRKSHQLPLAIERREDLLDYARGCVRAELRLYSMELKRLGLQSGQAWEKTDARTVWDSYMTRVDLAGNHALPDRQIETLPAHLRGTYLLWSEGRDVPALLTRRTFYRHRKEMRAFGIDITSLPEKNGSSVVPLIRIIEARPKAIPSWAYGTPLLAA